MVSEWAKPWATLNISAALLCKLKVSCRFPGAQTHVSGGNAVSIRIKKKTAVLVLKIEKIEKSSTHVLYAVDTVSFSYFLFICLFIPAPLPL